MSAPTILILGAGPRVGASVAEKFSHSGYNVAVVSRKGTNSKNKKGYLSLKADFRDPKSIPALFEAVEAEFKSPPSVVVYNAPALTPPPDKDSVLSIPVSSVISDLNVNTVSPYAAAQQALSAWEGLPAGTKKTFIYTGNILNQVVLPVPITQNQGMGKAAAAYWIGLADAMYAAKGCRFFYADERTEDGKIKAVELDGPAHAEFYAELVKHKGKLPWNATFVKGRGYVQF
ncbi:NAD(P)-binding protein [Nemania sp. FL0916]|nr:NAD(P)-binding protein [Nemania sp. FL0916]